MSMANANDGVTDETNVATEAETTHLPNDENMKAPFLFPFAVSSQFFVRLPSILAA